MIQETHDDDDSQITLVEDLFSNDFKAFQSALSSQAGGLLTLIPTEFFSSFQSHSVVHIIHGRLFAIILRASVGGFVIVNVHVEGDDFRGTDGKLNFLRRLSCFLNDFRDFAIYVGGDFNFVTEFAGRVSLRRGTLCGNPGRVHQEWVDLFPYLVEHVQDVKTI